ncbi:MAG: ACP S-malonyltransferase [Planctomycetota bacterium]
MSKQPVILCPGQGAQHVGMGKAWFQASTDAAQTFNEADEILGDRLNAKLSELCFEGPEDRLNRTDVTQPALFVAGVASFRALFSSADPTSFSAIAGLSLGEYTALHLAGAISFADALEVVALRGKAMQEAAEATESGMVALIGADEKQVQELCDRAGGDDVLVPANFNAPGQIVISGSQSACNRAVETASEMGLRATPLKVAGAFHSPIMQPAADQLGEALAKVELQNPKCPVLSNVTAEPHPSDPAEIRELLVAQLTKPVRWAQSAASLAETHHGAEFHELAPGKVLAGLMRRTHRETKVQPHGEPA